MLTFISWDYPFNICLTTYTMPSNVRASVSLFLLGQFTAICKNLAEVQKGAVFNYEEQIFVRWGMGSHTQYSPPQPTSEVSGLPHSSLTIPSFPPNPTSRVYSRTRIPHTSPHNPQTSPHPFLIPPVTYLLYQTHPSHWPSSAPHPTSYYFTIRIPHTSPHLHLIPPVIYLL
jgi:hypothetical protein